MTSSGGAEPPPLSPPIADADEAAAVSAPPVTDADGAVDLSTPPVAELADLSVEPSAEFVRRVRRRIHRRVLTSQVVDLSSAGVWQVAIEFLGMAFGLVEQAHAHDSVRGRRDRG